MIVVGLTGGISSGKSTVSNYIKAKGIPVIDADIIAREILKDAPTILENIRLCFGDNVFDEKGNLIRRKLGNIVFSNKKKLGELNRITHPEIKMRVKEKIEELKKTNDICFFDAALLIEGNFNDLTDKIVVVYIPQTLQVERLMKRDDLTFDEAMARVSSQMNIDEKIKWADYIIDNSYEINKTLKQVDDVLNELLNLEEYDAKKNH